MFTIPVSIQCLQVLELVVYQNRKFYNIVEILLQSGEFGYRPITDIYINMQLRLHLLPHNVTLCFICADDDDDLLTDA